MGKVGIKSRFTYYTANYVRFYYFRDRFARPLELKYCLHHIGGGEGVLSAGSGASDGGFATRHYRSDLFHTVVRGVCRGRVTNNTRSLDTSQPATNCQSSSLSEYHAKIISAQQKLIPNSRSCCRCCVVAVKKLAQPKKRTYFLRTTDHNRPLSKPTTTTCPSTIPQNHPSHKVINALAGNVWQLLTKVDREAIVGVH
jgi:hypothetical protein